jgi:hypothetical protein
MKVYHAVALSALAVPLVMLATPVVVQAAPISAGGASGPSHGTIGNPDSRGRLPGCVGHGHRIGRSHWVHCG